MSTLLVPSPCCSPSEALRMSKSIPECLLDKLFGWLVEAIPEVWHAFIAMMVSASILCIHGRHSFWRPNCSDWCRIIHKNAFSCQGLLYAKDSVYSRLPTVRHGYHGVQNKFEILHYCVLVQCCAQQSLQSASMGKNSRPAAR